MLAFNILLQLIAFLVAAIGIVFETSIKKGNIFKRPTLPGILAMVCVFLFLAGNTFVTYKGDIESTKQKEEMENNLKKVAKVERENLEESFQKAAEHIVSRLDELHKTKDQAILFTKKKDEKAALASLKKADTEIKELRQIASPLKQSASIESINKSLKLIENMERWRKLGILK